MAKRRSTKARKTHKRKAHKRVARKTVKRRVVRKSHKRKARKTVRRVARKSVRRVVRRSHSTKLPHRVTFRKGGKHTVVFKHRKATAATKAKRRASGKRLAKMWTKAERMANLRKAWAVNRKAGKRSHRRITRR